MVDNTPVVSFLRQLDFYDPRTDPDPEIHIIGCGGIGSFFGFYAAQMGFTKLILWDRDKVESHNVPNQNFLLEHIGMEKTDALAKLIKDKIGISVQTKQRFFTEESHIESGIVVAATDSIDSRTTIWKAIKNKPGVSCFIDGRLGGQAFQIFVIDPNNQDDIKFYESTLFASGEADQLPCTARAVIYVGAVIGGLMTHQLKCYIKNEPYHRAMNFDLLNYMFEIDGKGMVAPGITKQS